MMWGKKIGLVVDWFRHAVFDLSYRLLLGSRIEKLGVRAGDETMSLLFFWG